MEGSKFIAGGLVLASSKHGRCILTVDKVTPTGRVKTTDRPQWTAHGRKTGTDSWSAITIEPITAERAVELRKEFAVENHRWSVIARLKAIRWDDVSTRALDSIMATLDAERAT